MLVILIIIVLFMQTWVTLRRLIKKSLKWMFVSAGTITLLAFCLSNIDIIDYEKLNKQLEKKTLLNKYNLQLPQSDSYTRIEKRSLSKKIFIVYNNNNPQIIADNKLIKLKNINSFVTEFKGQKDEADFPYISFQLNIDKRIKMSFINKLKTKLANSNIGNINYTVIPLALEYNPQYYQDYVVKAKIIEYRTSIEYELEPIKLLDIKEQIKKYRTLFIKQLEIDKFSCNDTIVSKKELIIYLNSFINFDNKYLIAYQVNENIDFNNYLTTLISIKNIINTNRDNYSISIFNQVFEELDYQMQKEINIRFPVRITEITEEMRIEN